MIFVLYFCMQKQKNQKKKKKKQKLTERNLPAIVRLPSSVSDTPGESSGDDGGLSLDLSGQGAPTPVCNPSLSSEKYSKIYLNTRQNHKYHWHAQV